MIIVLIHPLAISIHCAERGMVLKSFDVAQP